MPLEVAGAKSDQVGGGPAGGGARRTPRPAVGAAPQQRAAGRAAASPASAPSTRPRPRGARSLRGGRGGAAPALPPVGELERGDAEQGADEHVLLDADLRRGGAARVIRVGLLILTPGAASHEPRRARGTLGVWGGGLCATTSVTVARAERAAGRATTTRRGDRGGREPGARAVLARCDDERVVEEVDADEDADA